MSNSVEARLVISATDRTGDVFRTVSQRLGEIDKASRSVARNGFSQMHQAVAQAGRTLESFGARATIAVTAPVTLAARRGYDTVLAFEKELNKAQALGEMSEEQRARVEANAREIGKTTQFTAKQALEMQRAFVQAGRTVEQAVGMAKPALNFALFGDVSPKDAADVITSVASAYRMVMRDASEAARAAEQVSDVIAKSANISRADVRDLAQGFKYAAPMAFLAGLTREELAGAIATMVNNGQRGDEAGVAMRSALVRLVKPTATARGAMSELGLSFDQFATMRPVDVQQMVKSLEAQGIVASSFAGELAAIAGQGGDRGDMAKAMTDVLINGATQDTPEIRQSIGDALGAYFLSTAERIDAPGFIRALIEKQATLGQLTRIFDARQASRLATLISPEYFKNVETLNRDAPGSSARGAAIMEQGLYGAHQRFFSAVENFTLSLAKSGVIDQATSALNSMASAINGLAETNPKLLQLATNAGLAAAALGPLALALGTLARAASLVGGVLGVGGKVAAAGGVAAASPAGAAIVAGGVGVAAGVALGEVANAVGSTAAGVNWTPRTADQLEELVARAEELHRRIEGIRMRSRVPAAADMLIAPLQAELSDTLNRLAAAMSGSAEITVKVDASPELRASIAALRKNAMTGVDVDGIGSTGKSYPDVVNRGQY